MNKFLSISIVSRMRKPTIQLPPSRGSQGFSRSSLPTLAFQHQSAFPTMKHRNIEGTRENVVRRDTVPIVKITCLRSTASTRV